MTVDETRAWIDDHRALFLDLVRIYVGVALFAKGIFFVRHGQSLVETLGASTLSFEAGIIAHYVVFAHVIGGALLALGLVTRLAAAIQLPVLAGAVLFVHAREGLFTREQSLELTLLVLALLGLFTVVGGGPLSVDAALHRSVPRESTSV